MEEHHDAIDYDDPCHSDCGGIDGDPQPVIDDVSPSAAPRRKRGRRPNAHDEFGGLCVFLICAAESLIGFTVTSQVNAFQPRYVHAIAFGFWEAVRADRFATEMNEHTRELFNDMQRLVNEPVAGAIMYKITTASTLRWPLRLPCGFVDVWRCCASELCENTFDDTDAQHELPCRTLVEKWARTQDMTMVDIKIVTVFTSPDYASQISNASRILKIVPLSAKC
eukprot:4047334-Pyramimonas_sp.AAC.1